MSLLPYLLVIFAYLVGSISAAILISKLLSLPDPRTIGSKNPGATNVLRYGGKRAAILTLLGDSLKGLVPVLIGHLLGLSYEWLVLVGIAAFMGHLFSIYYGFKGGKGVATAIGIYIGLNPIIGFAVIATWLSAAFAFNISSLSALIATLLAPFYFYFITRSPLLLLGLLLITLFIYWRHRSNIIAIINGTEDNITK
ncbi:MAG: acyl-phosphate glycerol 3-phosphate acyltransferase [Aquificaceae bacterium]|nr:MAG: acyl-phosphate glycerol 3-phosphate acyltransferase [Aquificaceae bacterium]